MIDLTGRTDVPVPEDVLRDLTAVCRASGVEFLVIGAAARDLVVHSQQRTQPVRASKDIDIAVAVRNDEHFHRLSAELTRKGRAPHKFIAHGVELDVIPFGGNEVDRAVIFADGNVFDATGIAEAHSTSVLVRMPQGTEVQVGSPCRADRVEDTRLERSPCRQPQRCHRPCHHSHCDVRAPLRR